MSLSEISKNKVNIYKWKKSKIQRQFLGLTPKLL